MSNLPDSDMKAHSGVAVGEKVVRPSPASYLVLTESGKDQWASVGTINARDPEAAIKAAVLKLDEADQAGVFVAVVASRWNPVTVSPRVERSLELKPVAK